MPYIAPANAFSDSLPVSSERILPLAPYPRSYIHGIVAHLSDAVQGVSLLRAAGYDASDIHILASWDYVEAYEQDIQRRGILPKMLWRLRSFFDEGFGDAYLRAACQGYHVLAIRLPNRDQVEPVRRLLAAYHVSLMKYVDTWVVADLPPDQSSPCSFENGGMLPTSKADVRLLYSS